MCFTISLSTRCGLAKTTSKFPLHLLPRKKIGRFEGLPQFQWTDPEGQDVIGQGSFGTVFVTESTGRKDGDSARKGETVVVKKLLF